MEKHLKPEIMNPSGSPPPELDSSMIENGKTTPNIISLSPEYPKYRDTVIIGTMLLLVAVFIGGIYLLTRHSEWSVKKSVENIIDRKLTDLKKSIGKVTKLDQQRQYSESRISKFPKPRGVVNDFADVIPQPYEQRILLVTTRD